MQLQFELALLTRKVFAHETDSCNYLRRSWSDFNHRFLRYWTTKPYLLGQLNKTLVGERVQTRAENVW